MRTAVIALIAVFVFSGLCPAEEKPKMRDGKYRGEASFVAVSVSIIDGKINDIEILRHGGGGKKYADMVDPLLDKMIGQQSTDIDAITGATVSSINLKQAVNDALGKASARRE